MFEKNIRQVNAIIARIFAVCTVVILFLVFCSWRGIFEFGREYTTLILIVGGVITISPSILIRILPDKVMKYYMLFILAVFIGILGTNNHIGIYITYILVPVFSCLYFEPKLVVQTSAVAYIVMIISVYINSATKYEVLYQHRSHFSIFIAYVLGFTIEFLIVNSILYFLVQRAKGMMEERYSAEEENKVKSQALSEISHEVRTPMNAIIGMSEVALRKEQDEQLRACFQVILSSTRGLLDVVNDTLQLVPDVTDAIEDFNCEEEIDFLKTRRVHILVVDDNALNREVLKELLQPAALEIDEAENGQQAVQMSQKMPYDLIFMDSHMPVMNGEEATRKIRTMHKGVNRNTPIIALTADAVMGVRERLILCGMNDYVVKPMHIEELYKILAKYIPKDKIVVKELAKG